MTDRRQIALHAAAAYLLTRQADDGHFQDYALPVGFSDAWVTAIAGLALAECGAAGIHPQATEAAHRAAHWLQHDRAYLAGWGFNGRTGADADSTSHVLQLLCRLRYPAPPTDVTWLLEHYRPDTGFATYLRDDGWGEPHPDVTPVAFLALPPQTRAPIADKLAAWVNKMRRPDRGWPAYWWRTQHYSTYWNLRLLRVLGVKDSPLPTELSTHPLNNIYSFLDLAYVIGILDTGCRNSTAVQRLVGHLLKEQSFDGHWEGSDDLRLTDPRYRRPWEEAPLPDDRTLFYQDVDGIITTATIVRVLIALR